MCLSDVFLAFLVIKLQLWSIHYYTDALLMCYFQNIIFCNVSTVFLFSTAKLSNIQFRLCTETLTSDFFYSQIWFYLIYVRSLCGSESSLKMWLLFKYYMRVKTHRGLFLVNNYNLMFTLIQHIFSNIKVCAGQIRREEQPSHEREKKIIHHSFFFSLIYI